MNANTATNRRTFLKTAGLIGAGSALATVTSRAQTEAHAPAPKPGDLAWRPFGKTGVKVPILSLGGMFDITTNQMVLRHAWDWNVKYWDTAHGYAGGKSEEGIGRYFERSPGHRKEIFLVSKASGAKNTDDMTQRLNLSLERCKTDYLDLYFLHGIRHIDVLTPEVKAWAEAQKKAGKIRLFGFSTHTDMAQCLLDAAPLGWIDGVMITYNYRLMHDDAMNRAVDACHQAGIGITAMKTQGGGAVNADSEAELKLAGHFLEKGFTEGQAKMKAVWQDERIAAICSQMPNTTLLSSNIAAALDRTELTRSDWRVLDAVADATCAGYCAGCADLCESATVGAPPISDVMRYLMYTRSYLGPEATREWHAAHAGMDLGWLSATDFAQAERLCPNHLPIAQLMREASLQLAEPARFA